MLKWFSLPATRMKCKIQHQPNLTLDCQCRQNVDVEVDELCLLPRYRYKIRLQIQGVQIEIRMILRGWESRQSVQGDNVHLIGPDSDSSGKLAYMCQLVISPRGVKKTRTSPVPKKYRNFYNIHVPCLLVGYWEGLQKYGCCV